MSEGEKEQTVRVTDRRRVDPNGDAHPESGEAGSAGPGGRGPQPEEAQAAASSGERASAQAEEVANLQVALEASRKRVDELARALQAVMQDKEDFKLRLTRERERMLDVERGNVALALIEAVDELDRSLAAGGDNGSALAQGVRMIRDGLLSKLQSMGVQRVEVVGQPFDPNLSEAADMEVTDVAADDQKIVGEVRAGYRLKDRVIRPARVKVAKYVKPAEA